MNYERDVRPVHTASVGFCSLGVLPGNESACRAFSGKIGGLRRGWHPKCIRDATLPTLPQTNLHMHTFLTFRNALVLVLLAALSACKDQAEPIPAYLTIQPFTVNAEGGAAWQKITDGWLYVNGEFLGAYTLPSTVPILAEGESEIIVYPGVKENGIAATPNLYPFMVKYTTKAVLSPAQTTEVKPVTSYDPDVKFAWALERSTFDGGSSVVIKDRDGDTSRVFKILPGMGFSGKGVVLEVDTPHVVMEIDAEKTILPTTREYPTWLELHYKCDIPFSLSLVGDDNPGVEQFFSIYQFNPTDGAWNKIYLNLTETLLTSKLARHGLYFRAFLGKNLDGKYDQTKGTVQLDNIRILYY